MTPSAPTLSGWGVLWSGLRWPRLYSPAPHASRTLRAPSGPAAPVLGRRSLPGLGRWCPARWGAATAVVGWRWV